MGISESICYSVPVGEKGKFETEVRRHPLRVKKLLETPNKETQTLQDVFLNSVQNYPDRNFLGSRDNISGFYFFKTYKETQELAMALGSVIQEMKLAPPLKEFQEYELRLVGVFSQNRDQWVILDCANILYNYTMVPFYENMGSENISYILEQTNISTCFCTNQSAYSLFQCQQLANLQNIVTFDEPEKRLLEMASERQIKIYQFDEIIKLGSNNLQPIIPALPSDVYTISYTSGTQGRSKGAILTHQNFVSTLAIPNTHPDIKLFQEDVHLSYLPLAHVMERLVYINIMNAGGSICFYRGDVTQLQSDIRTVKPTVFVSVPRLYQRFYDGLHEQIRDLSGIHKFVSDLAISSKLQQLKNGPQYEHSIFDRLVFKKTKKFFGGNVRLMATGSAPTSAAVLEFLKIAASCPVLQGYGQTESTGNSFMTFAHDPISGHVGGPTACVEFKLIDVPEMNYYSTDYDTNGYPYPRGEVCIRGTSVFQGYYKDDQSTREVLDQDGWLHTGDIALLRKDGSLQIIDRRQNLFQLAQGEYVAPQQLQNIYSLLNFIEEIMVVGDSLQYFCVAIVVPRQSSIEKLAQERKIQGTFEELCLNPIINAAILEKMTERARSEKLPGYEIVKKIYLEPVGFQDHGIISNSLQIIRHMARLRFKQQIEDMYKEDLEGQRLQSSPDQMSRTSSVSSDIQQVPKSNQKNL